jgi:CheY-like chemotaxis protein
MKTEVELNHDILDVIMKIEEVYPELSKYIGEMPVKSFSVRNIEMNIENLEDYCNTLKVLLKTYAISHIKSPRSESARKIILLIEDNIEILENLTEYLELEGYKVLAAKNGTRGVELARKFVPDLIICDVLMPEMDGHEVLRLLIDTAKTHEIPFIFSSSLSEGIDRATALKLGADDYIIKPFDPVALLGLARQCIKSGSKRQQVRKSLQSQE